MLERQVPEGVIPHRGPARLVQTILEDSRPDVLVCGGRVPADSAFVADGRVPAVVLLELAAQAAAAQQALAAPPGGAPARPGYLVAIRAATFRVDDVAADTALVATVRRTGRAGPLATYDVTVRVAGGEEIVSATLSTHAGESVEPGAEAVEVGAAVTDERSTLRRFIEWYASDRTSPHEIPVDELLAELDNPLSGRGEVRRELLREARSALNAAGRLDDEPARRRFNELREKRATLYLSDADLPAAEKLDAAWAALSEEVSPIDDMRRPETLHLAGTILEQRADVRRDLDDRTRAASSFANAWMVSRAARHFVFARRAVGLLLRVADGDDDRAAAGRRQLGELSEDLRHEADRVLLEVAARFGDLAHPDPHATEVEPLDPALRSWQGVIEAARRLIKSVQGGDLSSLHEQWAGAIEDAWDAVLTLMYLDFVGQRWDRVAAWSRSLAQWQKVGRLHGSIALLPKRLHEAVRALFDLLVQGVPSPEALDAFIGVMEPERRAGLVESFARRDPRPSPDEVAARRAAIERARAYPLPPDQTRAALTQALAAARRGPLGLALSGGGFRASFFHLGILARLAELDLLRSIDVISGVSGGSIVAACYYLKLKRLLEEKHDCDLSRSDYLALVSALCDEFLDGVQANIRTRIFTSPRALARLWFVPGYTRTNRVAELIASELFARATPDAVAPHAPLAELETTPFGEPHDFDPQRDNWRRGAKVPRLVLNATTLNTGHNWQFTTKEAGEPAFAVDREVDATPRLPPVSYPQAPADGSVDRRRVTLASAVAASACVPGIFPPIHIPDLYANTRVLLVDGGVFDNQGISALVDAGCENVIVSDGCRQIDFEAAPSMFSWSALQRTNAILMERVRQLQFRALAQRRATKAVRTVVDIHLTKGIELESQFSLGTFSPEEEVSRERRFQRMKEDLAAIQRSQVNHPRTRFGIPEEVQRRLARVRTDLDSFHDAEAGALFWSGYRMSIAELAASGMAGVPLLASDPAEHPWRFAAPWRHFADGDGWISKVTSLLEASEYRFFKLARLATKRAHAAPLIALAGAGVLGWMGWRPVVSVAVRAFPVAASGLACAALLAAVASIAQGLRARSRRGQFGRAAGEYFQQLLLGSLLPIAMIGAMLHLRFTDRWYLRRGAVIVPREKARRESPDTPGSG